jgi:hypothetical protein
MSLTQQTTEMLQALREDGRSCLRILGQGLMDVQPEGDARVVRIDERRADVMIERLAELFELHRRAISDLRARSERMEVELENLILNQRWTVDEAEA